MNEYFLDSSYGIALSVSCDQHHAAAVKLAALIRLQGDRLITTHAVVLEIGNALSRFQYRHAGIALIRSIMKDPYIEVIPISESLLRKGFGVYQDRKDKEWGLTDCISLAVMTDRNMIGALTADQHFQQAGFRALLKE